MKANYEVNDFVEITDMEHFNGLRGMVKEVKDKICKVHINESVDHSEFYINADFSELTYIGHYDMEEI